MMDHAMWPVKRTDNYVRFSIPNEKQFSNIEYKVLLNQNDSNLLRCSKVTCNGCLQLLYNVQQMQVVNGVLPTFTTKNFYQFLSEVIKIYRDVKKNGFMNQEHLYLDVDYMYLSFEPFHLSMIYLPVEAGDDSKNELLDGNIIQFLQDATMTYGHEKDDGIKELIKHLQSASVRTEEIGSLLNTGHYEELSEAGRQRELEEMNSKNQHATFYKNIRLVLKNSSPEWVIPITKEEFVIGKKASVVDGVILNHPTVSRIHCKVVSSEDRFYIVDLGSANGTLVNGVTCLPNIPVPIKNGDQITISDLIFYFMEEK